MPKTVQIVLRVPEHWLDEADEIARSISRPGMPATRTDAFRAAFMRGLVALHSEYAEATERARTEDP